MKPNPRDCAVFRHPSSLTDQFESKNSLPQKEPPLPSSVHQPPQLVLVFAPQNCSRASRTPSANFSVSRLLPRPPSWWQSLPPSISVSCCLLCVSRLTLPSSSHTRLARPSHPPWPTASP